MPRCSNDTAVHGIIGLAELLSQSISHSTDGAISPVVVAGSAAAVSPLTAASATEQRGYCASILDCARLLQSLVSDILDYSKARGVPNSFFTCCLFTRPAPPSLQVEAGRMELERIPLHLHDLLRRAFVLLRTMADERLVALTLELAPDAPDEVVGDPVRLSQAGSPAVSRSDGQRHSLASLFSLNRSPSTFCQTPSSSQAARAAPAELTCACCGF